MQNNLNKSGRFHNIILDNKIHCPSLEAYMGNQLFYLPYIFLMGVWMYLKTTIYHVDVYFRNL